MTGYTNLADTPSRRIWTKTVSAVLGLGMIGLVATVPTAAHAADALATMLANPNLTKWASWIQDTGMGPAASKNGPYTTFVPTNEAISILPQKDIKYISPETGGAYPDASRLIFVLRSHVVMGLHPMSELAGKRTTLKSLNGKPIIIDATNPASVTITTAGSMAHLVGEPIMSDNALIYPIDKLDVTANTRR
jgi:uncharacterized surface protein with fasciclin (FAS1) repeats